MIDLLMAIPNGEPVPAISLRQPWAGAVAFVGKDVENRRTWPFKYRGPIIIHASATRPYLEDFDRLRRIGKEDGVEEELLAMLDPRDEDAFLAGCFEPGAIVAVANLADVFGPEDQVPEGHPMDGSPWASDDANYWLYFDQVVPVDPQPFKGAVGMFKVPYDVAIRLQVHPIANASD